MVVQSSILLQKIIICNTASLLFKKWQHNVAYYWSNLIIFEMTKDIGHFRIKVPASFKSTDVNLTLKTTDANLRTQYI